MAGASKTTEWWLCSCAFLRFVACATHKCHVKKVRFSRAILKGENINLLTGFRFQVVFPRGRLSWVGFTPPQISTKEPLSWSPRRWSSLRQRAWTGSCPSKPWTPCEDLVWPSTAMPLLRPPRSCTSRTATTLSRMMMAKKLVVVPWTCVAVWWSWAHWPSAIAGLNTEMVDPWAQIMVDCLQKLMMEGPKRLICGFVMLSFRMPLVLQNRLLGGQAGRRIFVASASQPQVRLPWSRIFSTPTEASPSAILRHGKEVPCSCSSGVGTTWLWPAEDQPSPKKDHLRDLVLMFQCQLESLWHGLCSMSCVFHDVL